MNREKKQMIVLGVLALMIVSVGAFQMMGGSPAPAPVAEKKNSEEVTSNSKDESQKVELANPSEGTPLSKRDPFEPSEFAVQLASDPTVSTDHPVKPLTSVSGDGKGGKNRPKPWTPDVPFKPGGDTGDIGILVPPPPKFAFRLIGLVSGQVPAAVFSDDQGNQRLIELGEAIDSSSTLVAVNSNNVKIKFYGQTLVLTVGGNPSAK